MQQCFESANSIEFLLFARSFIFPVHLLFSITHEVLPGPFSDRPQVSLSSSFFPIQPSLHMYVGLHFLKSVHDAICHPLINTSQVIGKLILTHSPRLNTYFYSVCQINHKLSVGWKKLCYLHASSIPPIFLYSCQD